MWMFVFGHVAKRVSFYVLHIAVATVKMNPAVDKQYKNVDFNFSFFFVFLFHFREVFLELQTFESIC